MIVQRGRRIISDKDLRKLRKLCDQWVEQNRSHKEDYVKWREIIRVKHMPPLVNELLSLIEMTDKCNEIIMNATKLLDRALLSGMF